MLVFHPLYSSSSGNSFHLGTENIDILIDVGVSYKALKEALKAQEIEMSQIGAIFITHEHSDHIKALPLICRKHNIPIFACSSTASYLKEQLEEKNIEADIHYLDYGQSIKLKDIKVTAFETSHDALMPCGYKVQNKDKTFCIATDLGYVSNDVLDYLKTSNFTVLEANYDVSMLDFGKYPYNTKRRIKSSVGHLSNEDCANTILTLASLGQTNFLLAHLSTNNNDINIAKETVISTLKNNNIDINNININIATKDFSNEEFFIC